MRCGSNTNCMSASRSRAVGSDIRIARNCSAAVPGNFGYRQMVAAWRFVALAESLFGKHQRWGEMTRTAGHLGGSKDGSAQGVDQGLAPSRFTH